MKKLITLSLLTLSFSSFSQTQSGQLLLQGTVSDLLSITVTPRVGVNEALDLDSVLGASKGVEVADVTEISNHPVGYKVTISSAEGGKLKGSVGSESVPYTLDYGTNLNLDLSTSKEVSNNAGGFQQVDRVVKVKYQIPTVPLTAGTYSDTVTFTIATN